jgi:Sulfotransferase family
VNPYVFIVGCPRSGTTLLQRMVDAHPDLAIVFETHWIPRWFEKRRGLTPEGYVTPELVGRLLEDRRFKNLKVGRKDLERLIPPSERVPYASFVSGVFDLHGEAAGKRLVGDKTPAYVRSIPTLHELWPETRFVHIIRDGRDVFLSLKDWSKAGSAAGRFATWKEDPAETMALWWKWNVQLGQEDGGSLAPKLYHEVRYEELVSEPQATCEALCSFLGLPYDDAMLKFHEGREKSDPDLDAKKGWRPVTTGLRTWESDMQPEEVERFEAAAGALLKELGYPRAVPHPSLRTIEKVSGLRRSFSEDLCSQGHRLPERW